MNHDTARHERDFCPTSKGQRCQGVKHILLTQRGGFWVSSFLCKNRHWEKEEEDEEEKEIMMMLLICLASAIWLHLPVKAGQIPPGPRHHEWSVARFKFGPLRSVCSKVELSSQTRRIWACLYFPRRLARTVTLAERHFRDKHSVYIQNQDELGNTSCTAACTVQKKKKKKDFSMDAYCIFFCNTDAIKY